MAPPCRSGRLGPFRWVAPAALAAAVLLGTVLPASAGAASSGSAGGSSLPNVEVLGSSTLGGDLFCQNLFIAPGATLTTDGHLVACAGSIVNDGRILAGSPASPTPSAPRAGPRAGTVTAGSSPAADFYSSYGGSGGGGDSFPCNAASGRGYATLAPGGAGNTNNSLNGTNGGTPTPPTVSSLEIRGWYLDGLQNFLAGADGQTVCSGSYVGGAGSYGIYLQAAKVVAGTISSDGSPGTGTCSGVGLSGSGGGGVVLIAYGRGGYTPGTISVDGGGNVPTCSGLNHSGAGGNGSVVLLAYGHSRGGVPVPGPILLYHPFVDGRCVSVGGAVVTGNASITVAKTTFLWGDGARTTTHFPARHTYAANGTYHLAVFATFSNGSASLTFTRAHVPGAPSSPPPAVQLAPPVVGNLSVTVNGLVSADACGSGHLHAYTVDWGDHTSSASYLPASHSYAAAGTYRVCVHVTDSFGNATRACLTATVP